MPYVATLTFTKTADDRVQLVWSDHDPLDVCVVADTAEAAVRLIADHGDFEGQWLDQEELNELSTPEPVEQQATLGLARRVAVAPDDIRSLVMSNVGNGNLLRIDYRDNEDVLTTNRLIEPRQSWTSAHVGPWTYVRAYDHGRGEQRTFRLDRMERVELVEDGI